MPMKVRLLGRPAVLDDAGEPQAVRGFQSWAVLARVLLSQQPLTRRQLAWELFPDAEDPLGALRWCLASLRRAFNARDCMNGDPIVANLPPEVDVDVLDLSVVETPACFEGALLEGVEPRSGAEFSTWLLVERERVAGLVDAEIRQRVLRALAAGDHDGAIKLAELGVRRRPFDESAHVLLIQGLVRSGRTDVARQHVAATRQHFLEELGEPPSEVLLNVARESPAASRRVSPTAEIKALMQSGKSALSGAAVDAGLGWLRRAVVEAERTGDDYLISLTRLELGTALVHAVRGYDDEGVVFLREALDAAQRCGALEILIECMREIGYVEALAGRRPSAHEYLERALTLTNDPASLAGLHAVAGFNLVDWGKPEMGIEHYNLSREMARVADSSRWDIWSSGIGSLGHLDLGRLEDARAWLESCLKRVDDSRWLAFRPWPMAVLAEIDLLEGGDSDALRDDLEQTFALSCQIGDPCWEAAAARVMGMTFMESKQYEQAVGWFGEARRRCLRHTDGYIALLVRILASHCDGSLSLGHEAEAKTIARELLALAARSHMDGFVSRASDLITRGAQGGPIHVHKVSSVCCGGTGRQAGRIVAVDAKNGYRSVETK